MLENVLVRAWMTSPAITISPYSLLNDARQVMKDNDIRRLPVVDNNQLVGIITIGDIREASPSNATTLSIWELNYLWAQLTVESVMTRHLITIGPENSIAEAAELMLKHKIAGLPVVDATGNLLGMLTASDIFQMLVKGSSAATSVKMSRQTEYNP